MATHSKLTAWLSGHLPMAGLALAASLALVFSGCAPKLGGSENASVTTTTGGGQIGDPGTDFTLSVAQSSIVVPAGGRGSNGVSVSWINCAPSTITLDPDGLPAGLSVAFDTNPTPSLSSLSVAATTAVPPGTYPIRLMAKAGQILHQAAFDLVVPGTPGFALALSPAALDVAAGGSGKLDVAIQRLGGFVDPVSLSLQGAPAGVTGSFTSVPVPLAGAAAPAMVEEDHSLLLTVDPTTAAGTYTLTVHGTSLGVDHAASFFLKISPVADFSLSLTPSQLSAAQRDAVTGASTVGITRATGFTGAVTFAITGAPTGVTPRITPNPVAGASASLDFLLTLPQPGAYPIKITGTSGAVTHSADLLLTILPGGPDFQVTAPATFTADLTGLASGTRNVTVPIGVTALAGFSRPVALSASGLPAGVTDTFTPSSVTPTGTSSLVLTLPAATRPGTTTVTVTGDGGSGLTHTVTFQLTVINPGTFTLSATPVTIPIGPLNGAFTGTSTITITPANGFTGAVTLSATGLPAGVTAAFGPITAGRSTLTLTATTPTAVPGLSTLTITGVSGSLNASTPLALDLVAGPDFTLAAAPTPLAIQIPTPAASPATGTSTVTLTPKNGYTRAVTLSLSALPAGVTATFGTNPATSPAYTSVITFHVTNTAAVGSYPLTLTGTDGTLTRTTPLTLNLTAAPTFTLAAGPNTGAAPLGGSTTSTITVTPSAGFNSPVTLSLLGAPAGVTAAFAPNPAVSPAYTSAMTVNVAATVPAGTYPLTVQGTGAGITTTTLFGLTVTDFSIRAGSPVVAILDASGQTATQAVNVVPAGPFTDPITFSVTGLPAGIASAFAPNPDPTASTLTLAIGRVAPAPGVYTVTVTGTDAATGVARSTTFTLDVEDFTLTAPAARSVVNGAGFNNAAFTVSGLGGFSGALNYSVASVTPADPGITASASPASGAAGTTLTFTTNGAVALQTYTVTVSATDASGALVRSASLAVTVTDFSIFTPSTGFSMTIPAVGLPAVSQTVPVQLNSLNGFTDLVNLSTSAMPTGVTVTFAPPSLTGNGAGSVSSNMTITVDSSATPNPTGSLFSMIGTDASNGLTRSVSRSLALQPAADFTLTAAPNTSSIAQGDSSRGTISATALNGYNGTVNLSVQSITPAATGVTAVFFPSSQLTPTNSYQQTMIVGTTPATAPGTYTIVIQGSDAGGLLHTTTYTLNVSGFTLAVNPDPLVLLDTASTTATATVTVLSAPPAIPFADSVTIQSVTGAPANVSTSFTPSAFTTSGSGSITFSIAGTVVGGTYPITVTAQSSGGVTVTKNFTLDIQSITLAPRVVATNGAGLPVHVIIRGSGGGRSGTGTLDGTWLGGYTGNIALIGPGGGLFTFAFAPATLSPTGPTSSTMTVTIAPTGAGGPGTFANAASVTGNSPPLGTTANINLTVEDFTISTPTNPIHTGASQSANVQIDLARLPADLPFDEDITLTVTDRTGTWSAAPVVVTNPNTTGNLTISATGAGAGVLYPVVITATSASGVVHTFTLNIGI